MDERLLKVLACPVCKGDLELRGEKLICKVCKREYPIKEGIPILLPEPKDKSQNL